MNFRRTNITTALPYANGPVHIGHLAGVYVPADIYARYLRNKGEEVVFICLLLSVKKRMNMPETVRQAVKGRLKAKFPSFRRPESYFLRKSR